MPAFPNRLHSLILGIPTALTVVLAAGWPTTPGHAEAVKPAKSATLVLHTAFDSTPSTDHTLHGQVWIASNGTIAHNAVLKIAVTPHTLPVQPTCTLAAKLTCHLGDLNARGVTIPLTVALPQQNNAVTFSLDATASAPDANGTGSRTRVTVVPPPPKPSTTPTPPSSPSTPSTTRTTTPLPKAPSLPSKSPAIPVTTAPNSSPLLPEIAPSSPTAAPPSTAKTQTAKKNRSRHKPVSRGLVSVQAVWLLLLLIAGVVIAALPHRRRRQHATAGSTLAPLGRPVAALASSANHTPDDQESVKIDLTLLFRLRTLHTAAGKRRRQFDLAVRRDNNPPPSP